MSVFDYKVLVCGSGSIGRRHTKNLYALGLRRITVCDPDEARLRPLVDEFGVRPCTDLSVALAETSPDIVFICTPPSLHVQQALLAVRAGADVFIEKPISDALDGIDELSVAVEAGARIVQVGYNLRFHPGVLKMKELLAAGTIGRVIWARAEVGQYLPDWRPWQDYRQSYTAQRALGGGMILDGSHELDYIMWLLGRPSRVVCMAGTVSDLEVDVEDCATILLRFPNGAQADVHMDFVQRGSARSCKLAGTEGTILWDFPTAELRLYSGATKTWETMQYPLADSNLMYVAEVQDFLESVQQRRQPSVDLRQATAVLEVALIARQSVDRPMGRSSSD